MIKNDGFTFKIFIPFNILQYFTVSPKVRGETQLGLLNRKLKKKSDEKYSNKNGQTDQLKKKKKSMYTHKAL